MIIILDIILGLDRPVDENTRVNTTISDLDKYLKESLQVLYDNGYENVADSIRKRYKNKLKEKF